MFVSPILSINSTLVANVRNKSLDLPVILESELSKEEVGTMALVDSGAGGNFIDATFARMMKMDRTPLDAPLKVYNVDGTRNKIGTISEKVVVTLKVQGRNTRTELLVTGLGWKKVILGHPWLVELNPDIDWRKGTLRWRHNRPESSRDT